MLSQVTQATSVGCFSPRSQNVVAAAPLPGVPRVLQVRPDVPGSGGAILEGSLEEVSFVWMEEGEDFPEINKERLEKSSFSGA